MHYTCVPQYSELGVGVPYLDVSLTCACLYIAASQCQHKGSKLKVDIDNGAPTLVPYLHDSLTCACLYIAASQRQRKGSM